MSRSTNSRKANFVHLFRFRKIIPHYSSLFPFSFFLFFSSSFFFFFFTSEAQRFSNRSSVLRTAVIPPVSSCFAAFRCDLHVEPRYEKSTVFSQSVCTDVASNVRRVPTSCICRSTRILARATRSLSNYYTFGILNVRLSYMHRYINLECKRVSVQHTRVHAFARSRMLRNELRSSKVSYGTFS